jgi:hypothetical protein
MAEAIREELGDFLLHLAWQFVIAEERGEPPGEDAERLVRKMERAASPPLRPRDHVSRANSSSGGNHVVARSTACRQPCPTADGRNG